MHDIFTHTDLYQLNMGFTYFQTQIHERESVFEVYFRPNEENIGHHIFAGLEKIINVVKNFKISDHEIQYLKDHLHFSQDYLDYLKNLRFTGDIYAMHEGEVCYFNTPLLIVKAPLIQAQILETLILNIINYQTLIASKASRLRLVVEKEMLLEFGARRAYETEAALYSARSAFIGGFNGSSLVAAGLKFDIPVFGTHAHSFVQAFPSEYEAFESYARTHKNVTFLIDTYDVLNSGIINAIKVADKYKGKINFNAVRLDSGDLAYLSKEVRKRLDKAGYADTKIIASNDLDAQTILYLKSQNAAIDIWGIGTKLVSPSQQASLGAVYKLVSIENSDGDMQGVIKLSNNENKTTMPGFKKAYRMIDTRSNIAKGDLITDFTEELKNTPSITILNHFNQSYEKDLSNIYLKPLLNPIFQQGKQVYSTKKLIDIQKHAFASRSQFWPEHLRFLNPQTYYISYSSHLVAQKNVLQKKHLTKIH